ncbi:MAG: methylmalonyl-CoA decarboxylase [Bacteroidales bacterium]|nr:methylmalonyl-CoA decarboxylase [Bacteroidales bacterium]
MKFIKTICQDKLGILILSNEKKSNSLNLEMLDEFVQAFSEFKEKECRVVIIRSNPGSKVWCAGLRIDQLPDAEHDPVPYEYSLEKILKSVENFPGIVIAMIDGGVWGGGCELAFACDILIGSAEASFAITPAKISAPYNPNQVSRVLQRVGNNIALEMFATADVMNAERAASLGILNYLANKENLEEFSLNIARKILSNAPLTIALIKKQIHGLATQTMEQLTRDENNREFIKTVYYSQDFKEGKKAFLEKRRPQFSGK